MWYIIFATIFIHSAWDLLFVTFSVGTKISINLSICAILDGTWTVLLSLTVFEFLLWNKWIQILHGTGCLSSSCRVQNPNFDFKFCLQDTTHLIMMKLYTVIHNINSRHKILDEDVDCKNMTKPRFLVRCAELSLFYRIA